MEEAGRYLSQEDLASDFVVILSYVVVILFSFVFVYRIIMGIQAQYINQNI